MDDVLKVPITDIKDHVYYLHDYQPWQGGSNPKFDMTSGQILDLKEEDGGHKHNRAVILFSNELSEELSDIVDTDAELVATFIPSSDPRKKKTGLREILSTLKETFNITNSLNPLIRHTKIPKATGGGPRSKRAHLDSIRVSESINLEGKTVLLIDDVTTSGCSMDACEELLYNAGASIIIKFAVGATV